MSLAPALTAPLVGASELEFSVGNGRVTILAEDAPVSEILAEWARVGQTTIVDADQLTDETVSIQLVDVPETEALRTLLRAATGYIAAPRATMSDGVSRFDRILILATSTAPPPVAPVTSPAARGPPGQRRRVAPNAQEGRTPFTVSPAQQEQLDQLQRLLQQEDGAEAPDPTTTQPTSGAGRASGRRGRTTTTDPLRTGGNSPAGAFGSTTPPPDANGGGTPSRTIPRP